MFLCDYHTHTRFSFDGDPAATHDAMCRRALEVGLSDIAFTDHCDINGEVEKLYDFPFDPDTSWNAMMEAKEKYKGRLNVVCGIELGNATQYPEAARAVLDGAFRGCGIEEITLPEGTLSLGSEAFAQCENLKQVVIPESVKDIGENLLKDSPQAVIVCRRGSAAETYAMAEGYPVEYLSE